MKIQAVSEMTVSFMGKIPSEVFATGEIKDIRDDEAALLAVFNYKGALRLLHPFLAETGIRMEDITDKFILLLSRMQKAILENDTKAFCEVGLWLRNLLAVPTPDALQNSAFLAEQFPRGQSLMKSLIDITDRPDNGMPEV